MNIGEKIEEILREDGHSVTWFAKQICCTRSHAYKIFQKNNIDVDLLRRISIVLNHNFFLDIANSIYLYREKTQK